MSTRPHKRLILIRSQPFLYITGALITGIVLDRWLGLSAAAGTAAAASSLLISAAAIVKRNTTAAGLALVVGFVFSGAALSGLERTNMHPLRLKRLFEQHVISPDDPVRLTGVLVRPPEPSPTAWYIDLRAEQVEVAGEASPAVGCVRLILPRSSPAGEPEEENIAAGLEYGSRLRLPVRLEQGRRFKNPGSPDYNKLLELNGYDLKGTIKSPLLIERLGRVGGCPVLGALFQFRLRAITAIERSFGAALSGTLKAMLFGNRYFMDRQTTELLREGSTFHVISISGMHMAIIAWLIIGGGSALRTRRLGRIVLCLATIWLYALMVGLAPPITRASVMITIGLVGPALFRSAASINSVALAAFVMLVHNPALVGDAGFQFSFVAVGAIVIFALPLQQKLRLTGGWIPTPETPHPPLCSRLLRAFSECLFWNQRSFDREMKVAAIRFKLDKSRLAVALSRSGAQPMLRWTVLALLVSAVVQAATLPLSAYYFNRVAPIGILLNLTAGLLTGILMVGGLAGVLLGWLGTGVIWLLNGSLTIAHTLLVDSVLPFIEFPWATFRVGHYEGSVACIYGAYFVPVVFLAFCIDAWMPVDRAIDRKSSSARNPRFAYSGNAGGSTIRFRIPTAIAVLILGFIIIWPPTPRATGRLTCYFMDVGQGDSALIIFPKGTTMLIDAGSAAGWRTGGDDEQSFQEPEFSIGDAVVSRFLWSRRLTRIDYALATHAHLDHVGGLPAVLKNFTIGELIIGTQPESNAELYRLRRRAEQRVVPTASVRTGDRFDIDGATVEVLWPPPSGGFDPSSGNDDSIVLRIRYGSVSFLLAGDIESLSEHSLVANGVDLKADVLKVPHHGSQTSSTPEFLDAVNPKVAVVSAGERNQFGHPHSSVVERYQSRGIRLLNTGATGMVTATTDGVSLDVRSYQ